MDTVRTWSRVCIAAIPAVLALHAFFAVGAARAGGEPGRLTEPELRRVLQLGPWPLERRSDPGNRLSGDPFAIAFGQRLFFDSMLSSNGYVACASCHQPDRAWTDRRPRAQAIGPSRRNTPSLVNLTHQRWWGWAGASDSLWMATLRPLLDPDEMNSSPRLVARRLTLNDDIACRYRRLFGWPQDPDDPAILVNVAKAIAAFQETLETGRTPFDEYRDALARGADLPSSRYPAPARRGLRLFVGKGLCAECHSGPNFSDGRFHATGVALGIGWGPTDAGRAAALGSLGKSTAVLRRTNAPSTPQENAPGAGAVNPDAALRGAFRTPGLRNVAVTPPYMHDGSIDTLDAVLRRYAQVGPRAGVGVDGEPVRVAALDAHEIDDLKAFLETLTDALGAARMPRRDPIPPCD